MNKKAAFLTAAASLVISSVVSAYVAEPELDPDSSFVPYKPQVLVTPDRLPLLRWPELGAQPEIGPAKLHQLELCAPAVCPQAALDAGAAYFLLTASGVAYYDEQGRLVGTSDQAPSEDSADTSLSREALASATTDTAAGVPAQKPYLVGATPGTFEVLPSGAATYRIPIDIPPGTADTQPQLALSYNSQGGNGLLGVGWSLEGLSAITRCPQTFAQDNNFAGITYTSTDRFCLDGKRLVRVGSAAPYGANGTEYRTELDTFSKITAHGTAGTGPATFVVKTKSGEILRYGAVNDTEPGEFNNESRIEAQGKPTVAVWALDRVTGTAGNYFTIDYVHNTTTGEFRPTSIAYTGSDNPELPAFASVTFEYESRPDPSLAYRAESKTSANTRMASIVTRAEGKIVRKYDLFYQATDGDTPLSRLAHIQTCANTAASATADPVFKCLPPTSLTWHAYPRGFQGVKHTNRSADRDHNDTHTMDVNGDGLDDLVYANAGRWHILFSHGDGFGTPQPGGSDTGGYTAVFDYDGDGREDLAVLPERCDRLCLLAEVDVLKSTGTGFQRVHTNITYTGDREFSGLRAGDFDGNGRADLVIGEQHANTLVIYLNTNGVSFTRRPADLEDGWIYTSRVLDYDGDGRTDLMKLHSSGTWYVMQSTGDNFTLINTGVTQHGLQLADVNGNGLQDAIVIASGYAAIRLNLGGSFGGLMTTPYDIAAGFDYAQAIDFNSDGREDLFVPVNGYWNVLRATPTGTSFELLPPTPIADSGYNNGPQIGDFNGDGLMDLALDYSATWHLYFHKPGNSGLVTGFNAGGEQFNDRIVVNYRPLTQMAQPALDALDYEKLSIARLDSGSFYKTADRTPDAEGGVAGTIRALMAPIYVTESYKKNNGVGGLREYAYNYEGAKVDIAGRGYLGFGKVTVRDIKDPDIAGDDLYSVTDYARPRFPFTGLASKTEVHRHTIDDTPLNRVANVYAESATLGNAVNPYVERSTDQRYNLAGDLLTTTRTANEPPSIYGNFRNITVEVLDHTQAGQNYTTTTVNSYTDDPETWRLGRLARSTVTQTSGTRSITRVSAFEYSSITDLLIKETVQPGGAFELSKTYGRDEFGNIITERVEGADIAPRRTETLCAPRGRFVYKITNAEDHVEFHAYDHYYGGITSLRGPNGLTTFWNYDVFGRKATNAATGEAAERRADGTNTNITYAWCNGACPNADAPKPNYLYKITTTNTGAPTVIQYFDTLNREVLTQTASFDGRWSIVATQYDALGQVLRVSRPHFEGHSPSWTEYGYDHLGRVTSQEFSSDWHNHHPVQRAHHHRHQRQGSENQRGQERAGSDATDRRCLRQRQRHRNHLHLRPHRQSGHSQRQR